MVSSYALGKRALALALTLGTSAISTSAAMSDPFTVYFSTDEQLFPPETTLELQDSLTVPKEVTVSLYFASSCGPSLYVNCVGPFEGTLAKCIESQNADPEYTMAIVRGSSGCAD